MQKKNIFKKKFNQSVLSTTKRIESFFNFFKENFFNKKKKLSSILYTIDQKIFLILAIIFMTTMSYFLLPAFYNKDKIKAKLENQILAKYNLEVKLGQSLKYGLFPKPHFYSRDIIINYKSDEIAKSNDVKISILINNFFSLDNVRIKNLKFKKTDFKINFFSSKFFIDLLNNTQVNNDIDFLNSKLFYLDKNESVIFLTNINNLNYLYKENFLQVLDSKLDIFNIPISLKVEHNDFENFFFFFLNSQYLRLNIQNKFIYNDQKLDGQLDLTIVNKNRKINYRLKDNSLKFNSNDNDIIGDINIKPFFLSSNLDISRINLKKIFKDNSILVNILKSEILNNKNLNGKLSIKTNNFESLNFLKEIKFDLLFEEGDIFLQNLETIFKDSVIINISDTQLIIDNYKLSFAGYIDLNFKDITEFYTHYQINRNYRKNIKKINFGFLLNLDDRFLEIDNLKVNGKTNQNLEKFLNEFNSNKEDIFNKIIMRNSIKNFLKNF